jgi:NDP-sugar pyrophosphorylase family protein
MQALILAGGEGTRMGRLTADLPKPLLYLPGGTFLEHELALLSRLEISHTFVVTRHRERQVSRALRGLKDVTQLPQKTPFTLLGALATAEGHATEPFVVLHGDNYFSQDLDYLGRAARCSTEDDRSGAIFLVEAVHSQRDEAARLASTGCYILSPGLLHLVREVSRGDELRCLTRALLKRGVSVEEVPLRGWRANVNELNDLLTLNRRMLERWSATFHPPGADEGYDRCQGCSHVEYPLWVSSKAEVFGSRLGPFVAVGPHAVVRDCALRDVVVFPGAEIRGLSLQSAIVLPGQRGPLVLPSQDEGDRRDEGHGEEEPP